MASVNISLNKYSRSLKKNAANTVIEFNYSDDLNNNFNETVVIVSSRDTDKLNDAAALLFIENQLLTWARGIRTSKDAEGIYTKSEDVTVDSKSIIKSDQELPHSTAWLVSGVTRTFSDIDGGGSEVAAGDSVTVQSDGLCTVDLAWSGADGSRLTSYLAVNPGGVVLYEAGVTHYMQLNSYWQAGEGGYIGIEGTSGSRITIGGGDGSNDAQYLTATSGGHIYCSYVNFQYFNYSVTWVSNGGFFHLDNCTSDNKCDVQDLLSYRGGMYFVENCSFGYAGKTRIAYAQGSGYYIFKDCTFLGDDWMQGLYDCYCEIIGTVTIDGAEVDENTIGPAFILYAAYYPKALNKNDANISGAYTSSVHPSMDEDGNIRFTSNGVEYVHRGHWSTPTLTDSNGESIFYELKKVYIEDTWIYISDSGQAEAGDNQKWTRMHTKTGYSIPSADAQWAGTNSVFTLSAAGVGISNHQLSDYAITELEKTTAEMDCTGTPTIYGIKVNGKIIQLDDDGDGSFSKIIKGWEIGACSAEDVLFFATKDNVGDQATAGSTLTVTASEQYGAHLKALLEAIQTLLRSSSRTYLGALDDNDIFIGERLDDYDYPNINIEPAEDDIIDNTTITRESELSCNVIVASKGYPDADDETENPLWVLTNLVGDVVDELEADANRVLTSNIELQSVSRADFDYVPMEDNMFLRWCLIRVTVQVMRDTGA